MERRRLVFYRAVMLVLPLALGASLATAGCDGDLPPYVCKTDGNCVRGDEKGRCLAMGALSYCAFTDSACGGGLRWDTSAATELSDTCVTPEIPDLGGRGDQRPASPDLRGRDDLQRTDGEAPPDALSGAGDLATSGELGPPADLLPAADLSSVATPDLAPRRDLTLGTTETGEACTSDYECAPNAYRALATCVLHEPSLDGTIVGDPGGYCQAPCDPAHNDPQSDLDPECPGFGYCGADHRCRYNCSSSLDCSPGYICLYYGQVVPVCVPQGFSQCNPDLSDSCPLNFVDGGMLATDGGAKPRYRCVEGAPDDSSGICALHCDPLAGASACPSVTLSGAVVAQGCYADGDGDATCWPSLMKTEGQTCQAGVFCSPGLPCINDCGPGLTCTQEGPIAVCRAYCSTGASAVPCPTAAAPVCGDLSTSVSSDVLGICAPVPPDLSFTPSDLSSAPPDLALPLPDLASPSPDLATPLPDLAMTPLPDLAMTPTDLMMSLPDLSPAPPDLSPAPPDLSPAPPDLSSTPPDLTPVPDLTSTPADLTSTPADLTSTPADLASTPADLASTSTDL